LFSFIKLFIRRFNEDRVMDLSAQCAYYFLLSLFPFLLVVVTLLGYLPFTSHDVIQLVAEHAPGSTNKLLEDNIEYIMDNRRTGLLSFGIIITLWSATAAMDSLVRAINLAYRIRKERSFIRSKILSVILTFGMIASIFSALLLIVFGEKLEILLHNYLHFPETNFFASDTFRWIVSYLILNLAFLLLYYVAPNTCVSCKDALPGSIFAALGWQLISLGFSYYVNNFGNFSATYGSLGGVIILTIWFYLSALILIVGGVVNSIFPDLRSD